MTQIKSQKALTYMASPESCDTGAIGMVHAVALAETEAEERHAAEMKVLKDKAIEAINTALCYYGCSKGKYCEEPCERRDLIIKKLTEK